MLVFTRFPFRITLGMFSFTVVVWDIRLAKEDSFVYALAHSQGLVHSLAIRRAQPQASDAHSLECRQYAHGHAPRGRILGRQPQHHPRLWQSLPSGYSLRLQKSHSYELHAPRIAPITSWGSLSHSS